MPFGGWKVCDTGVGWRVDFRPTLTPSESESRSELLGDAYRSCHLWVRQNQLTFLCGLEVKEVLRKARGGECGENKGELACVGAPQGAAQRHSSTLS